MGKTSIHLILSWLAVWACAARAEESVLLDFDMQTPPPPDWAVEGYAFGVHDQEPEHRQRAAVASRNQRQYQTGRIISPQFIIDDDYLQVVCSGVFHPTQCAVVLVVDGKDVRSCSPEPGCGFLGFDASPGSLPAPVKLSQPPVPAEYWFDLRSLQGKRAKIEVRDEHLNGYFSMVKIVATDRQPPADAKVVTEAVRWLPKRYEAMIDGDFLLLPVGALAGTPLQAVTVQIDGRNVLEVDLPLAFGSIPVVGYLPAYDLTGHQGKPLKISFHSYTSHDPTQASIESLIGREIPGRVAADDRPAFHIHNRIGLLNDPNGLVYADGVYHVFHQFNYNITACSWAHYVSKDLVHWKERPVGLWHDGMGSMHSGSAAVDVLNTSTWQTNGTPPVIAAYTASRGMGGRDKIQMQCIAHSTNGARTFTKYEENPVLGESQVLAKGSDSARDPKLFWFSPSRGRDPQARDGHWVMVLFEGKSLNIYTSDNLRDWEKHGHIDGFHECPELFPLAVDGDSDNVRWIMYGGSGAYHIGVFDGKRFTPETGNKIPMYHDGRCYAAQTFNNTEPGFGGQPRRIQIGWQGGRLGQLSTPTELTLRTTPLGLRVCKQPVCEIAKLRTHSVTLDGAQLIPGGANPLVGLKGGLYDIKVEADLSQADRLVFDIRGVKLTVEASSDGLQLGGMKIPGTHKLSLRLIVDNTSLDIFFGEHGVYYSPKMITPTSKSIGVEVIGGPVSLTTLRGHELKSIW
jgi:fructan beta-fructosidase